MILWTFLISLLIINTGCFYQYESAMAKNSTDLKDFAIYRESVDNNTRQTKLYSKFNTVMIANVSLLGKNEIQQYKYLTDPHQLATENKTEIKGEQVSQVEVDLRQEDFLKPFLDEKSLIFFLSLHVPPPTRYLAEKFMQYWHVTFRRTGDQQDIADAYSIKVHDLRDLDKEIAEKYFPYVNRWSSEYVITVEPKKDATSISDLQSLSNINSPVNSPKEAQSSLELVLTSELGQAIFTW